MLTELTWSKPPEFVIGATESIHYSNTMTTGSEKVILWVLAAVFGMLLLSLLASRLTGTSAMQKAEARATSLEISLETPEAISNQDPSLLQDPVFGLEFRGEIKPRLARWDSLEPSPFLKYLQKEDPKVGDSLPLRAERFGPRSPSGTTFAKLFNETVPEERARDLVSKVAADVLIRTQKLSEALLKHSAPTLYQFDSEKEHENMMALKQLAEALEISAIWRLHQDQAGEAFTELLALQRLSETIHLNSVVSFYIKTAFEQVADRVVTEGLLLQKWTPEQLLAIEQMIAERSAVESLRASLPGEIRYSAQLYKRMTTGASSEDDTSFAENPRFLSAKYRFGLLGGKHAEVLHAWMDIYEKIPAGVKELSKLLREMEQERNPTLIDNIDVGEATVNAVRRAITHHAHNQLMQVAIFAEQFRQKNNRYPGTWKEMPEGLQLVDLLDPKLRPLTYKLDEAGRPVIFSKRETEEGFGFNKQQFTYRYSWGN